MLATNVSRFTVLLVIYSGNTKHRKGAPKHRKGPQKHRKSTTKDRKGAPKHRRTQETCKHRQCSARNVNSQINTVALLMLSKYYAVRLNYAHCRNVVGVSFIPGCEQP